jgi:hypothetical protein
MSDTEEKKTKKEPKVSNASKANIPKNNQNIKTKEILSPQPQKPEKHSSLLNPLNQF